MPNLITHYLCGLEAIKNIENEKCSELIKKHQNVFNLGVQGPDILFYYGIWPWSAKADSTNIGEKMHVSKVNLAFKGFIDYIIKQNDYIKDILTVYLMGYLCHNCMDSIGHPYVFYRSGFKTASDPNENLYIYYHRRFETAIDVLLCNMLLNKRVHEIGHNELIEITVTEQNIVSEMYSSVILSVFNSYVPKKKICRAIKDMIIVETLFKDPHGIKRKAVACLDYLIYGFPLFSSIIFPRKVTDGLDYLNLKNTEWCMPFDKNHKSTLSFIDLFKEAYLKTQRFCDVLYSSIFCDNSSIPYALKLFGNNSYTSGIDCDIPVKFRYHDIIFKDK
ncbi:MAG TPA: zinc dependent phospholipase C family protein [Ruminiclostridium sp.]